MEEDNYDEYDNVNSDRISDMIDNSKEDYNNAQTANFLNNITSKRDKDNFLHHQIATEEMIERLEHFYKGDFTGPDEHGDIVWQVQKNKDLVTLNEFGVTSIMEIITKYIDKNTILSYYSENRIYEILADIGDEMTLFILCNYEKMGMDTYFKKTKFRLLITTTLHIIESTYRRALHGKTMEEINQSKVVGQFGNSPKMVNMGESKKQSWLSRIAG